MQPAPIDPDSASTGMYGVRVVGLEGLPLGPVPSHWPVWEVTVEQASGEQDDRAESVGPDTAFLRFGDGATTEMFRKGRGGEVRLVLTRQPSHVDLAHPYLAAVGMVSAYWSDRIPFHAGAVGIDGTAWLVLGSKGGGKSTTLASLALSGHPVLADDLSVVDPDLEVHRGPRFIDLRREASAALGVGQSIGVLGARERWRYHIGPAPLTLPLGGIVVPSWGEPAIETVAAGDRFALMAPGMALLVPGPWNELFLHVAMSVPVLRWRRPRGLDLMDRAIGQLLAHIGGGAGSPGRGAVPPGRGAVPPGRGAGSPGGAG